MGRSGPEPKQKTGQTFRRIADLSKYLASRDFGKSKLKTIGVYHAAGFFFLILSEMAQWGR